MPSFQNRVLVDEKDIPILKDYLDHRVTIDRDGCWIWRNRASVDYGYASLLDGTRIRAHRLAWLLYKRTPMPVRIAWTCARVGCCNPDHLAPASRLGTAFGEMRAPLIDLQKENESYE